MLGGIHRQELENNAGSIKFIEETRLAEIKARGCQCQSLKVNAMWSQVVAGTNWWFHVTTDKGEKWSITVFQHLPGSGQPSEIRSVQKGHMDIKAYNE